MPTFPTDLLNSKTAFKELFRLAPIGICITDRARRFVLVDPAPCRVFGEREGELLGREFTIVLAEEDCTLAAQQHDDFLKGRTEKTPWEWRLQSKDGTMREVLVDAARLVSPSGSRFKLIMVQNVTARKKRQSDRSAREREGADRLRLQRLPDMI